MKNSNRKITFISGTRADFGKLRPLIDCLYNSGDFSVEIIATGMHLLKKYGYTINEIYKSGFDSVFPIFNQESSDNINGDVNLDGVINVLDVVLIVSMALSNEYSLVADLNEDGAVDILDIVILIAYILDE